MQSMVEGSITRRALVALRKVEERAAVGKVAEARRAAQAAERARSEASRDERQAASRLDRALGDGEERTAGRLALRHALRARLREEARQARRRLDEAVRRHRATEEALDIACARLEGAHQARLGAEAEERSAKEAGRRARDRREHRAVEDRGRPRGGPRRK